VQLLVTTSHSVLKLDTDGGEIHHVHSGEGLYYGLTHNNQNYYVAARGRMVSSDIPQEDERGEILIFDSDIILKSRLQAPFPLRDMHQIAWFSGKLWITCSYDNMIAIWDGLNWRQWFPLAESTGKTPDMHHFNSLMFEGRKIWVLAHNYGPSELISFSLGGRKLKKRIMLGNQAHNIWREGKQWYTCSSGSGKILGNLGFSLDVGGFLRGYADDGKERCIGVSELAERKGRDVTNGKVLVFDMEWKLLKTIDLPQEGLILDFLKLQSDRVSKHAWLKWL